jgi:hypothetical protein
MNERTDTERLDWLEANDGFIDQYPQGNQGPRWEAHGRKLSAYGASLREAIDNVMALEA